MSKLGKILTFVGISGAALGGLWYFLDTTKKAKRDDYDDDYYEDDYDDEPCSERAYVSLEPDEESCNAEALKKVVTEAVSDMNAKAEEAAEGVGLVKEETDTKDFEFESFDKDADEE